jgi:hypothetical protein
MRPLTFLLILTGLFTAGCHKSGSPPSLSGPWKWVESDWILGTGSGKAYPGADTTIILDFLPNHRYQVLLNGKVVSSDSYVLNYGGDSSVTFDGLLTSSSEAEFGLGGSYLYSTFAPSDTVTLVTNPPLATPAGASTTMKFVIGIFN